ncbi:MAG: hypothetical protein ACXWDO_06920 [Bacteroidia bacterium]
MKYIYALVLFFALALPDVLHAQFDNIRYPLMQEEIAVYKKNKVLGEIQKFVDKGVAKNYRARALDTGGRLLANITYDRAQYYLYDNAGRVIAHMDSVRNTDGTFTVQEYTFGYDEQSGKLIQAITPEGTINFTFDRNKNILTQAHFANDTLLFTKYHFDAANRWVLIEGFGHLNKLVNRVERVFSSGGTLFREEIVAIYPAGTDSTIITYLYDAKKKLQKKQIFNYSKFYVNMEGAAEPTHSAERFSVGTFTYTYDKKGPSQPETIIYEYGYFE